MGFDPKSFLAEPDSTPTAPAFDPQAFLAEEPKPVEPAYQPKPGDIPINMPKPIEPGPYGEDIARFEQQKAQTPDLLKQKQSFIKPPIAGTINLAGTMAEMTPKAASVLDKSSIESDISALEQKTASITKEISDIDDIEKRRGVTDFTKKQRNIWNERAAQALKEKENLQKKLSSGGGIVSKAAKAITPLTQDIKKKTLQWSETISPIADEAAALREDLKDIGPGKDKFIDDMVDSYKKGTLDTKLNWFGSQALLRGDKKSAELSKQLAEEYRQAQLEDWQKQQQDPNFVGPVKPVTPGKFREITRSVARMAPGLVTSMAVSAVPVVGAPAAFAGWASQGAGQVYQDAVAEGADPEKARISAAVAGPIYAAIEQIQIGQIAKNPVVKKKILHFLKEYGIDVAKEVNEEGLQGAVTTIATEKAKGNDDVNDIAKKAWESYLENAKSSITSLAVVTGATRGAHAAVGTMAGKPPTAPSKPGVDITVGGQNAEGNGSSAQEVSGQEGLNGQAEGGIHLRNNAGKNLLETGKEILKGINEEEQGAILRKVQGEKQAKEEQQNIVSGLSDEDARKIIAKAKIPGVDATKAAADDLARVKESADKLLRDKKPTGEGSIYNMVQPAPADQEAGKTIAERHGLNFVDATEGPRDQGGVKLNFQDEITGKTISAPAETAEGEITKLLADTRRDKPEEYGRKVAEKAGVEFVGQREQITGATGKGTYESEKNITFKTPIGNEFTVPFSSTVEEIKKEAERLDDPKIYGEKLGLTYNGQWETGHHEFLDNETKSNVTIENLADLKESVRKERAAFSEEKEGAKNEKSQKTETLLKPEVPVSTPTPNATQDSDRMLKMYLKGGKTETSLARDTHTNLLNVLSQVIPLDIAESLNITEEQAAHGMKDLQENNNTDNAKKIRDIFAPPLFYGETVDEAVKSIKRERPAKGPTEEEVLGPVKQPEQSTPRYYSVKTKEGYAVRDRQGTPKTDVVFGNESAAIARTNDLNNYKDEPMKETAITPTKAGLVGAEKKVDVPREQTVPPAQPEVAPVAIPEKQLTQKERRKKNFEEIQAKRAAAEGATPGQKLEEIQKKKQEHIDKANKLIGDLGKSFTEIDPNTFYMAGTRQAEIAFDLVYELSLAGYHKFREVVEHVKTIAGKYMEIKGFCDAIQDAYDANQMDEEAMEKRTETIDEVLNISAAPARPERRVDTGKRKAIDEMTDEEKTQALTYDELTGMKSKRAWEDLKKLPVQVLVDADGLKWINDNLGYAQGNELLQAIGQALKSAGIEAYRIGGDEIRFQDTSTIMVEKAMEKVYNILKDKTITATAPDGTVTQIKGLGVSYGYAEAISDSPEHIKSAEKLSEDKLHSHKVERERLKLRSPRGEEPPGLSRTSPTGIKDQGNVEPAQTDLFAPPSKEAQNDQATTNAPGSMDGSSAGLRSGTTTKGNAQSEVGRSGNADIRGNESNVESGKQPAPERADGSNSTKLLSTETGGAGNSRGDEPVVTPNLPAGEKPKQQLIDYLITEADQIGIGGAAKKTADNIAVIKLLKQLEKEDREPPTEENTDEEPPETPAMLRGRAPGSMTLDALKEKVQGKLPGVLSMLPKDLKGNVNVSISKEFIYKGRKFGGDDWEAAVWYDPNGKVVEVHINPNISEKRLAMALMHELPGHIGSRLVYADNQPVYNRMKAFFDKMNAENHPSVTKIKRDYEVELSNDVNNKKLFDEWTAAQLADYIENDKRDSITTRIYNFFREILTKLGVVSKNLNETMREMIKLMRKGSYEKLGGNGAFAKVAGKADPVIAAFDKYSVENLIESRNRAELPLFSKTSKPEAEPAYKVYDRRGEIKKVTEEDLPRIYKEAEGYNPEKARKIIGKDYEVKDRAIGLAKYAMRTLSGRLLEISPIIRDKMQKHVNKIHIDTANAMRQTLPLLEAMKKLPESDYRVFDIAAKNSDIEKMTEIAEKHGFGKALEGYRGMMNEMIARATSAGYETGYLENYFPRIPRDRNQYYKFIRKTPEWGQIQEALQQKAKDIGRDLQPAEQDEYLNQYLRGYAGKNLLGKPGNLKERKMKYIDNDMNSLLEDSIHAIPMYVERMMKKIGRKELFGNIQNKDDDMIIDNLDESIGEFVGNLIRDYKLNPEKQDELIGLLKSYFNFKPTDRTMAAIKNISYATSMGSGFSSMFSQMQDMAFGFLTAPQHEAGSVLKALMGKTDITVKDLGIQDLGAEFRDPGKLFAAVDKLLSVVGLKWGDITFKNAFIQANLQKFRQMARTGKYSPQFRNELTNIFEERSDELIDDLKNKRDTDLVKLLVMNEMSKFQPITQLQVPQAYLDAPRMRIAYALKTYQINQVNAIIDEGIRAMQNAKSGDEWKKAFMRVVSMMAILMAAGIGMDALKDFLFRRKATMSEYALDNLLKLVMISRYTAWQARTNGWKSTLLSLLAPPLNWLDYAGRDIRRAQGEDFKLKNLESLRMLPVIGQEYYWWYGGGAEQTRKRAEKNLPPVKFEREMRKLKSEARRAARRGDDFEAAKKTQEMKELAEKSKPIIEEYYKKETEKPYPKKFRMISEFQNSKVPKLKLRGKELWDDLTPGQKALYSEYISENREKK